MNKLDTSPQCQAAMPYYYDHLCGRQEQIPQDISVHIASCPDCQNEVQWLKQTDTGSEEFSIQKLQAISHATQMQLHCALIDRPVRCSTIKSFLPILAIPDMAVKISTPVTVHIQACAECAQDLEILKELDLSDKQRYGLSQIFSQKQSESSGDSQAVTDTFFRGTTDTNTAIRGIMDRPDSGVVTCFQAKDASVSQPEKLFTVEITKDDSFLSANPPADHTHISETRGATTTSTRSRWVLKPLAAAAAVIIATILLFQSPSVKATDIGQIYEALKNVKNIVITQYEANNPDPIQTIWISRSLDIKLLEAGSAFTLYDINSKTQKNRINPASDVQQTNLNHAMTQSIAKSMEVPWGLLPFKNTSELPAGAVWEVQPEGIVMDSGKTEIYDLFWIAKIVGNNSSIYHQWRCHIDVTTKHPLKVEWWQKTQQDQEYELITFTEITYPTEGQIQEVIDKTGL